MSFSLGFVLACWLECVMVLVGCAGARANGLVFSGNGRARVCPCSWSSR